MLRFVLLSACISLFSLVLHSAPVFFDPIDFGAKGDGTTLDTESIQAAIDACAEHGGGTVRLAGGHFRSGTIYLKDHVSLYIEAGAVLHASDDLEDFPSTPSRYHSYWKGKVTLKALIYAEDVRNISIGGRGVINGNGDHWVEGPYGRPTFSLRPRIIHFRGCSNIHIRDITLYNSATWVQSYYSCKDMLIDGVSVDSRPNKDIEKERFADVPGRNNDGLNLVDCERVRVSNCNINSGDDAIVLKSLFPEKACRDITISNCVVSSNASGIKIGTETSGRIEDVVVQNCVVFDTRNDAICMMTVDGTRMERISFSDITCRNIKQAAIFIRLGNRNRTYREGAEVREPHLKDVMIRNVQGTRISGNYGCVIAGLSDNPVENISLDQIRLEFEGGGTLEDSYRTIPEREGEYPSARMFGKLPAYGMYVRHARNLHLSDIEFRVLADDARPALLCDNIELLRIRNLMAESSPGSAELIRLVDARDALLEGCMPLSATPVFLTVHGKDSEGIVLLNNTLKDVAETVVIKPPASAAAVMETGTVK